MIARFFPPSRAVGARRALRFAEGLSTRGFRVSVLTTENRFVNDPDPDHVPEPTRAYRLVQTTTHAPTDRLLARRRESAPAPQRTASPVAAPRLRGRLFHVGARLVRRLLRPDEDLGWVSPATRAARRLHRADPIDIVIPTMPPYSSFITAARVARRTGAILVADYRDPWAANREIWSTRPGFVRFAETMLERRLLASAALVLFTSPSAREFYRERFEKLGRTEVLYNGIDSPAPGEPAQLPESLTWLHAGHMHGGRRSLAPLLDAMARLRHEVPLRLVLYGPEPSAELAVAQSLGIEDRVEWRGNVSLARATDALRSAHRLVAVISADHPFSIPAKLFDYRAAARPILLIADPRHAAAAVLAGAQAHRTIAPTRGDQLEELICEDSAALAHGGLPDVPLESSFSAAGQMDALAGWLRELLPSPH